MNQVIPNLSNSDVFSHSYLSRCQIATPDQIVDWVWEKVISKGSFGDVIDLGCGDARFAQKSNFDSYVGVDIEYPSKLQGLPAQVKIEQNCGLLSEYRGFDLCIGNPPYVRHHDMNNAWQEHVAIRLGKRANLRIDKRSNAYLYFMLQALLSVRDNGLVALLVPFEWVSRPSSSWLRGYIDSQGWSVEVYRLPDQTFPRVLTTASLSLISKTSGQESTWKFYRVDDNLDANQVANPSGTNEKVLDYSMRSDEIFAQRGLSPGTQRIFCLTEEGRLHARLSVGKDVTPCITSLRNLPRKFKVLGQKAFEKHYVDFGARCWLIRSDKTPGKRLMSFLEGIPPEERNTSTCNNREKWYKFQTPVTPDILYSLGFIEHGPHIVENQVGAVNVGAVGGIHCNRHSKRRTASLLRAFKFEDKLVGHSGVLKKVEINQMNAVLKQTLNLK